MTRRAFCRDCPAVSRNPRAILSFHFMKKTNLLTRIIIILVITLVSLYIVAGPRRNLMAKDFTFAGINNILRENIRLGLDLRGGSQLVMRVKTDEYLQRLAVNNAPAVEEAARAAGFAVKGARADSSGGNYRITLEAQDASKMNEMRDAVTNKADLREWAANVSGNAITWTLTPDAGRRLSEQAVEQSMNIIESRINTVGVAEPTLQRHGAESSHQILLQMPGIQDPERLKQLIVAQSRLDLVHVISPPSPAPAQSYATREEAVASLNSGGNLPANRRVLEYAERDEPTAAGENANNDRAEAVGGGRESAGGERRRTARRGSRDGARWGSRRLPDRVHIKAGGRAKIRTVDGRQHQSVHGRRSQRRS